MRSRLVNRLRRLMGSADTGHVERFDDRRLTGWIVDPKQPAEPASLTLYADDRAVLAFVANGDRQDVEASGLGPRRCGFDIAVPRGVLGPARLLEVRLNATGQVLRGGRITLPANPSAALQAGSDRCEGVAFFDPVGQRITGWALGTRRVAVSLDDGPAIEVALDRSVAGFGPSVLAGFAYPVPDRCLDGRPHRVQVSFDGTSAGLDGTPFEFSALPVALSVELAELTGGIARFTTRGADGAVTAAAVAVFIDGRAAEVEVIPGGFTLHLPGDTTVVLVQTTDGAPLGRYHLRGGTLIAAPQAGVPTDLLTTPETLSLAREAFSAFCALPDARFDPAWYRIADPQALVTDDDGALIGLYRQSGARRGIAPNGLFDEQGLRASVPALAEMVEDGSLPCLFALELALGERSLPGFSHLPPHLSEVLGAGAVAVGQRAAALSRLTLPSPRAPTAAQQRSGRDSIYSAWLSRLVATADQIEEIAADDRAVAAELAATALLNEPLVSIIMPTWNRAFTISEAIQSVIEQSYPNWELIVCDDASEDLTAEAVRQFDDPRIRYNRFLKSNGAGARNKGLRFARGEFIAYLDSDNIWHPLFLDLMMRRLLANPGVQMAYGAFLDTTIHGATVQLDDITRPAFRPIPLSSHNVIDLNGIVHHRRLYDWLGGFDEALPRLQDWDLVLRYSAVFRPLFVDRIGVFYRRNAAWGQVTQVFVGSGAETVVAEKTRRRLTGDYERLAVPDRGSAGLTVLPLADGTGAYRPQDLIMAIQLAQAAAQDGRVDLILPADCALTAQTLPGLTTHRLEAADLLDATALGDLVAETPVLAIGPAASATVPPALFAPMSFVLEGGVEGGLFRNLADPSVTFSVGPVPLTPPRPRLAGNHVLVLAGDGVDPALLSALASHRVAILIAPTGPADWQIGSGNGGLSPAPVDAAGLAMALADVGLVLALTVPEALSPLCRALIATCQGHGVAVMLPDDRPSRADGFAGQWIEAGAALPLPEVTPDRLMVMATRALADRQTIASRARSCHAIADQPALFRERLASLAHRAATETLQGEVEPHAPAP